MAYLNHAGTSWPKPSPVLAAVRHAFGRHPSQWASDFESSRGAVAEWIGAEPTRLLLTPSCTAALSVGILQRPWQAGDRLVMSGLEHDAVYGPARQLADRGIRVVVIPGNDTEPVNLDMLQAALTTGARLVVMSAVSNVTGDLLPWKAAATLASSHGIPFLLDAAQLAGWLPLPTAEVDLLAFAGHKGPQAPWGIGGLYVAPGSDMPGYCDVGSVNRAALAGLVAAIQWLDQPEQADRLPRAKAHTERLRRALGQRGDATLLGHADPSRRMPTLAFTLRGQSTEAVGRALDELGVVASSGRQCAPLAHRTLGTAPLGVIRLSTGPLTTAREIEQAVAALQALPSA